MGEAAAAPAVSMEVRSSPTAVPTSELSALGSGIGARIGLSERQPARRASDKAMAMKESRCIRFAPLSDVS
ncbi:MAG: hypothetical protein NVSMB10_02980 [Steroidobacteraceae bacterium]